MPLKRIIIAYKIVIYIQWSIGIGYAGVRQVRQQQFFSIVTVKSRILQIFIIVYNINSILLKTIIIAYKIVIYIQWLIGIGHAGVRQIRQQQFFNIVTVKSRIPGLLSRFY